MTPLEVYSPAPSALLPAPQDATPGPPAEEPSRRRLLAALVPWLFVAALALLLGSFPARNSDLWLHLAAGKHPLHANADAEEWDVACDGIRNCAL